MRAMCDDHQMQLLIGNVTGIKTEGDQVKAITVIGADTVTRVVEFDHLLAFYGLSPKLGPIANWGLGIDKNQIQVDNRGEVILGGQADPTRSASVQGDTFYWRDLSAEARTVANKMPANTRKVSDGRVEGYVYDIRNDFADTYTLFIYYSDEHRVYRVALVEPRLGGSVDAHGGHIWPDGTLCLTKQHGSGYPSMEDSYAKSVLWTLGMSLVRRGHEFQFNLGQNG